MKDALKRITAEIVGCRACPRLVAHREKVAREKRRAYRDEEYWGRPVPGFGDPRARLILVGLAPGAHGSNRTGRMFTGDASGDTLFAALHAHGFASQARAHARGDGLHLCDCFITAAVRCAPPGNRPSRAEHEACLPYLVRELKLLRRAVVYLALGKIGFDALIRALRQMDAPFGKERPLFGHHTIHPLADCRIILASYHPSRQNTQTGRLTPAMFGQVFQSARARISTR